MRQNVGFYFVKRLSNYEKKETAMHGASPHGELVIDRCVVSMNERMTIFICPCVIVINIVQAKNP